jgi:hypothetical protein
MQAVGTAPGAAFAWYGNVRKNSLETERIDDNL